ncbi:MAG TPA: mechanosensitive ion channel domain-containing protein [Chthoniobacterales bacterium]
MPPFLLIALLFLNALAVELHGQTPTPAPAPSPSALPTPTPIALQEVPGRVDSTSASIKAADVNVLTDEATTAVDRQLPILRREISARLEESSRLLSSAPSLETLQTLDSDWGEVQRQLDFWMRSLTRRATDLAKSDAKLGDLAATWQRTLDTAKASGANAAVVQRITGLISDINKTRLRLQSRGVTLALLQNQVAAQLVSVSEAFSAVRNAQQKAYAQLFQQDVPRIWESAAFSIGDLSSVEDEGKTLMEDSRETLSAQWTAVTAYAERHKGRFVIHGVLILLFTVVLRWMRDHMRTWCAEEQALQSAAPIFAVPMATAVVLSLLFVQWIYPFPPRLLHVIVGSLGAIPTILIMRRMVEFSLQRLLNALAVFYGIGLFLAVAASLPVVSRIVFLLEMLGGAIFCIWFLRTTHKHPRGPMWERAGWAVKAALVVMVVGFLANAFGYSSISKLLVAGLLWSAYGAMVLAAAVNVVDAIVAVLLHVPPFANWRSVRHSRPLLLLRFYRFVRWAAMLLWVYMAITVFYIRRPIFDAVTTFLNLQWTAGATTISPGNILQFFLVVAAAFLISKFIRFVLDEEIYPRVRLARGVPYAISTLLHYALLLVGFLVAVTRLGYDLTKVTILAGAFGVGLGFGLQNIVNNFVSGLILLFERPVQVGDVIQLGDISGRVTSIGIRASIVQTMSGSEVVVPNGKLVSDSFTNWTLSNRQHIIEISVNVVQGADPLRMIGLLKDIAKTHERIVDTPEPQALFAEFVPGGLKFILRVWTDDFENWRQVNSELVTAVHAMLVREQIRIL